MERKGIYTWAELQAAKKIEPGHLTKKELNDLYQETINAPLDPELVEICKALAKH